MTPAFRSFGNPASTAALNRPSWLLAASRQTSATAPTIFCAPQSAGKQVDPVTRILAAALVIARQPPQRETPTARSAYVRWESINELRTAFEAAGIDWRNPPSAA